MKRQILPSPNNLKIALLFICVYTLGIQHSIPMRLLQFALVVLWIYNFVEPCMPLVFFVQFPVCCFISLFLSQFYRYLSRNRATRLQVCSTNVHQNDRIFLRSVLQIQHKAMLMPNLFATISFCQKQQLIFRSEFILMELRMTLCHSHAEIH